MPIPADMFKSRYPPNIDWGTTTIGSFPWYELVPLVVHSYPYPPL